MSRAKAVPQLSRLKSYAERACLSGVLSLLSSQTRPYFCSTNCPQRRTHVTGTAKQPETGSFQSPSVPRDKAVSYPSEHKTCPETAGLLRVLSFLRSQVNRHTGVKTTVRDNKTN